MPATTRSFAVDSGFIIGVIAKARKAIEGTVLPPLTSKIAFHWAAELKSSGFLAILVLSVHESSRWLRDESSAVHSCLTTQRLLSMGV